MLKYHPPEVVYCLLKRCLCCNEVPFSKISLMRLRKQADGSKTKQKLLAVVVFTMVVKLLLESFPVSQTR